MELGRVSIYSVCQAREGFDTALLAKVASYSLARVNVGSGNGRDRISGVRSRFLSLDPFIPAVSAKVASSNSRDATLRMQLWLLCGCYFVTVNSV